MNLRSDYGCRNLQVYIAIKKRGAEKARAFDPQKWRRKIGARPGIFAGERRRNEERAGCIRELYGENK